MNLVVKYCIYIKCLFLEKGDFKLLFFYLFIYLLSVLVILILVYLKFIKYVSNIYEIYNLLCNY